MSRQAEFKRFGEVTNPAMWSEYAWSARPRARCEALIGHIHFCEPVYVPAQVAFWVSRRGAGDAL